MDDDGMKRVEFPAGSRAGGEEARTGTEHGAEGAATEDHVFHGRNHRFGYLIACEVARRMAVDPTILDVGARHLARFAAADPHQRAGAELWSGLIVSGPNAVIERLTERSARGDHARQTAPSFGALPPGVRAELLRRARAGDPPGP